MKQQEVYIENLKCGGCASTIIKKINSIEGVKNTEVNTEKSLVTFICNDSLLNEVKNKLSKLGYPPVGDKNTMLHKAKSFVSCATGKIDL